MINGYLHNNMERHFYISRIDIERSDIINSKIYYRRGVQVDVIKPHQPIFLADQKGVLHEILIAVKRNVPGFWDAIMKDFITEPKFLNHEDQALYLRHSPQVFASEKRCIIKALSNPRLAKYVPFLFESDDYSVATEFVNGELLEHAIKQQSLNILDRVKVIRQLIEYIYFLHAIGLNHNDYHGRNIIVKPDRRIKVIDYSMAGIKNLELPYQWDDISRVNQYIVRTLTSDITEKIRLLTQKELQNTGNLRDLLRFVPFTEANFYQIYRSVPLKWRSP